MIQLCSAAQMLLLRAAVAAALVLPLGLPAAAAPMAAHQLPQSARFAPARSHAFTAADAFRATRSHKANKAAKTAHFNYPYGVGADVAGNVYVTNFGTNDISVINSKLKATAGVINQGLSGPVSVTAVGNGNVYAFIDDNYLLGNGSVLLRSDALQAVVGPAGAVTPIGAACGLTLCWYTDTSSDTLWVNNGSNTNDVALGYVPGGVALDQLHNRVFVADPLNNAVHVYNAQTLAAEKTII